MTEYLKEEFCEYNVVKISKQNINDVYNLLNKNEYYLSKVQNHKLTVDECIEDINALPDNKTMDSKTYVSIYDNEKCICLIDIVTQYPNDETAFLGLFILDVDYQQKGVGTLFFKKIENAVKKAGFKTIRLGCMSGNEKGKKFWSKMGFKEVLKVDRKIDDKDFVILVMSLDL